MKKSTPLSQKLEKIHNAQTIVLVIESHPNRRCSRHTHNGGMSLWGRMVLGILQAGEEHCTSLGRGPQAVRTISHAWNSPKCPTPTPRWVGRLGRFGWGPNCPEQPGKAGRATVCAGVWELQCHACLPSKAHTCQCWESQGKGGWQVGVPCVCLGGWVGGKVFMGNCGWGGKL